MKTAIILHGYVSEEEYRNSKRNSPSNGHWLSWIQHELLIADVLAQAIELPKPYEPTYDAWKNTFERFDVNEETMLIGHSCGGGFLVRWLSENPVSVGKVALVAPWLDPHHELPTGIFDFTIDPNVPERTKGTTIFVSDDDEDDIHESVKTLTSAWPKAKLLEFSGKGHFTYGDMHTREFPELKGELLG